MNCHRLLLCLTLTGIISSSAYCQSTRIFMDGVFSDWQNLHPLQLDSTGDQQSGNIDFRWLWATNDENYLFLRIDVNEEINFQDLNNITLFLDTDNQSATGIQVHGIGAELQWSFGNKSGIFAADGINIPISQANIGLITAPTVSSTEFEIALKLDAQPDGRTPLFNNDVIRMVFEDRGPGGDLLPDAGGGVSYSLSNLPLPPLDPIRISKQNSNAIRFLSYNTQNDGLFAPSRSASFTRLIQAIQPEIIGFQEIDGSNHTAEEVAGRIESILPSNEQQQWYGSRVLSDIYVVSRYPIFNSYGIRGVNPSQANGAFLIDLRPQYDSDMLLIVAHPPCCDHNSSRQFEIDALMAFIRDAKASGGALTLEPETPIIIIGDMNLVGDAQQLNTLLTGQIINTNQFGSSFAPDWDGSDFSDLNPRITHLPMFFTWYSESSFFSPGRLDVMIYSDSVIESLHSFVLFTPVLPADTLAAYNLQSQDAVTASDHLPVVGDFTLKNMTGVQAGGSTAPVDFTLEQNYPNPFNPGTIIRYHLPYSAEITLKIYNVLGQEVKTFIDLPQDAGTHEVHWNGKDNLGRDVATGVYIYELLVSASPEHTRTYREAKKMILLR